MIEDYEVTEVELINREEKTKRNIKISYQIRVITKRFVRGV